GLIGRRPCEDKKEPGDRSVRDEHLGPGQPVVIPALRRARRDRACVGARSRLGQGKRAEPLSGAEAGKKPLPLLFIRERVEVLRAEEGMRPVRERGRSAAVGQRFHRQRGGQKIGARPAILFRNRDPHDPEPSQLGKELRRKPLLPIGPRRDRSNLLSDKSPKGLPKERLFLGKGKGHGVYCSESPEGCQPLAAPAPYSAGGSFLRAGSAGGEGRSSPFLGNFSDAAMERRRMPAMMPSAMPTGIG